MLADDSNRAEAVGRWRGPICIREWLTDIRSFKLSQSDQHDVLNTPPIRASIVIRMLISQIAYRAIEILRNRSPNWLRF